MRPSRRSLLVGGAALAGLGATGTVVARRRLGACGELPIRAIPADGVPEVPPGESLDFFVTGDTGHASELRASVVRAMLATRERARPSFVVLTGDNVYPAGVASVDDPAWRTHFEEPFGELGIPFYPCLGNHDHMGDAQAEIDYSAREPLWKFPSRYHSFRMPVAPGAEAEFFVLDTAPIRLGALNFFYTPEQVAWLDQALASSTARWKIAVGHHPLFSGGPKPLSSKLRWHLLPPFAEHTLDLYLSGHEHDLELLDPGRGWLQVVSGAGSGLDAVAPTTGTLFCNGEGGFAWISLRRAAAFVQFVSEQGTLATFRVERPLAG